MKKMLFALLACAVVLVILSVFFGWKMSDLVPGSGDPSKPGDKQVQNGEVPAPIISQKTLSELQTESIRKGMIEVRPVGVEEHVAPAMKNGRKQWSGRILLRPLEPTKGRQTGPIWILVNRGRKDEKEMYLGEEGVFEHPNPLHFQVASATEENCFYYLTREEIVRKK